MTAPPPSDLSIRPRPPPPDTPMNYDPSATDPSATDSSAAAPSAAPVSPMPPPPDSAPPSPAAPPQPARPAARKRMPRTRALLAKLWHGCLVSSFCFVIFTVFSVGACAWSCAKIAASGPSALRSLAEDAESPDSEFALEGVRELNLAEKGNAPGHSAPCVLFVPLVGEISSAPARNRPWEDDSGSASAAVRAIRRATLDPRIRGILLRVDSPGGEVTASDIVWKALADFRASSPGGAKEPRFVVALLGSLAASGGYYVCAGADWIIAHPTTITGSIGVKMTSFNVRRLAERLGVGEVTIASGENKNMLSPFQDLTEGQRAMLQAQVNAMQDRFVTIVSEGRHLDEERVRALADGRIFLAPEAKEAGLVDEIGYVSDAKARVAERLGGRTPRFVAYAGGGSFLRAVFSPDFVGASIRKAFPEAAGTAPAPRAGL